jgi:hypothetical protein
MPIKTSLAEITNTVDPTGNKIIKGIISGEGNEEQDIYLTDVAGGYYKSKKSTSPCPEVGATVIVLKTNGFWFYLTGVANSPIGKISDAPVDPKSIPTLSETGVNPSTTSTNDPTLTQIISDTEGNALVMTQQVNDKYIEQGVKTQSSAGKKIDLNDSPGTDSILIQTNNNDYIALTESPKASKTLPSRALVVNTMGAQRLVNRESTTDILVYDGEELNLLNNSGGGNSAEDGPSAEHFGNVNIQSRYRDINLFTGGDGVAPESENPQSARIFIECLNKEGINQLVQIDTQGSGTVRILARKVEVSAGVEGLDIISQGDINMVAAGSINMKSNSTNIKTDGNINADGEQIWLNSGQTSQASVSINPAKSFYGDEGNIRYSKPINPPEE